MSQFHCYADICRVGSQFCETVSERCRDCRDFTEYCLKDNLHISNCSTYCYDMLMKNISLQANSSMGRCATPDMFMKNISLQTNSSMGRCATPDDGCLSDTHHLMIFFGFIIIGMIGIVLGIFLSRWQLVSEFMRRINGVLPSTEPERVEPGEKIDLSVMQPFIPQGKDCQVTVRDPQVSTCGFTQHNQIPNSRKDDPSLCLSGRRDNHGMTII